MTGPDGAILARTILGDRLLISPEEADDEQDQKRVFYFDLPLVRTRNQQPLKIELSDTST